MAPATRIAGRIIDVRNGAFWYPFCSSCLGKVTRDVCGRLCCPRGCGDVTVLQHRYRLVLQVSWSDSTVQDVVLFGQCLESVFGVTADEFVRLVAAESITHATLFDCLCDALTGQYCLFDVASRRAGCAPVCRERTSHVTAHGLHLLCDGFRPVRDILLSQNPTLLPEDDGCSCIGAYRLHCDRLRDNSIGCRSAGQLWQPGSFLRDENSSPGGGIVYRLWSRNSGLLPPSLVSINSTGCVASVGQPPAQGEDAMVPLSPSARPLLPRLPGDRVCESSSAVAATLDSWSSWNPDSPTTSAVHVGSRSSIRASLSCKPAATGAAPVPCLTSSRRRTRQQQADEPSSAYELTSTPPSCRSQSETRLSNRKLGDDSFIPRDIYDRSDSTWDVSAELHRGPLAPVERQQIGAERAVVALPARASFQRTSALHSPSSGRQLQCDLVQPTPTPAEGQSVFRRASKRLHPPFTALVHSTPISGDRLTPNGWSASKRQSLLQAASPVLPNFSQSSPSGHKLRLGLSAGGIRFNISSPLFPELEESTLT